ncbi:hypothetical protein PTSG_03975 [Salpingoeca rosetta]|uniref:RING-type domain-containing protein n=1 Tax=Salpingoeca rosetta (strain ATCC 50818 / BSB-021) TaxID=946362 RepID=F2U7E9_SALR5|nr:uncharacterized protein PTSG_03975 [Salpingoeca rosetta]EGD83366.1 hypothetical protein PTSG_03975 [Salpingoeca rosetta]|eukprot:XP_004994870.1 hypothetical protein PTSG_03975 [Salpingoeca rosetta]
MPSPWDPVVIAPPAPPTPLDWEMPTTPTPASSVMSTSFALQMLSALRSAVSFGGDVTPSSLVSFYHSWRHLKADATSVDVPTQGAFDPDEQEYYTSLLIIAGLFVVAFLLVALWAVFCMCRAYRRNSNDSSSSSESSNNSEGISQKRSRRIKIACLTCGLVAIATAAACIYPNVSMNGMVSNTVAGLERLVNRYNAAFLRVTNLGTQATDTLVTAHNLQGDLDDARQGVQQALEDVVTNTTSLQSLLSSVVQAVPSFEFDTFYSDAERFNRYRSIAEFGLIGLMVLVMALSLAALVCGTFCQRISATVICILLLLIVMAVVGAESAATVGISDMCMQPSAFLIHHFAEGDEYVQYYLLCDRPNPSQQAIDQTEQAVGDGLLAAQRVLNYTRQHAPQYEYEAASLHQDLLDIQQQLPGVVGRIDCSAFWEQYTRVVDGVCDPATTNLSIIAALRLASCALFLVVLVLASCTLQHEQSQQQQQQEPQPQPQPQPQPREGGREHTTTGRPEGDHPRRVRRIGTDHTGSSTTDPSPSDNSGMNEEHQNGGDDSQNTIPPPTGVPHNHINQHPGTGPGGRTSRTRITTTNPTNPHDPPSTLVEPLLIWTRNNGRGRITNDSDSDASDSAASSNNSSPGPISTISITSFPSSFILDSPRPLQPPPAPVPTHPIPSAPPIEVPVSTTNSTDTTTTTLSTEGGQGGDDGESDSLCHICCDRDVSVQLTCRHWLCSECSIRIARLNGRCPYCRAPITIDFGALDVEHAPTQDMLLNAGVQGSREDDNGTNTTRTDDDDDDDDSNNYLLCKICYEQ